MNDPQDQSGRRRSDRPPGADRARPGPARRRRAVRVALLTATALLLATAGAGAWFYVHLLGNLKVFDGGGVAAGRPPAGPTDAQGGSPVNVLLLGSDTRTGGNEDLGGGPVGPGSSDTAILLHVYGDHRHAVGVWVPRDALVDIPPCRLPSGGWTAPQHGQMFNSAFAVGGSPQGNPACSQNTVEALTGLRVDHTVVIDFQGLATMSSAVGGVEVCVPNDVNEYGIHLRKGRQTVAGRQALDYVRARHGIGDGSDIGRIKRQQAFLAALARRIQDQGFDLTTLLPLADAATRSLTVDPGLGTPMRLVTFAQSLRSIRLPDITFVTAPWRFAGDRVALVHPDADTLWQLLRQDRTLDGRLTDPAGASPTAAPTGTAPTPTAPDSAGPGAADPAADPTAGLAVPVTVLDGAGPGTAGLVPLAERDLRARYYQEVEAGTGGTEHAVTTVDYPPGRQADAERLAQAFPGAQLHAAATADTPLTVTLGTDYARAASPTAPATAPASASPTGPPTGIAQNARPADTDPCAGLT
ncbi:hypothetical protein GCM10009665_01870 [Kitasatospora nipponensis]|uniref:LytR family transcriptional attenuator n=1 Tax=Kitasatospora nipponensis TaxID=258049 RepID=A0ABN1VKY7_9ACTN